MYKYGCCFEFMLLLLFFLCSCHVLRSDWVAIIESTNYGMIWPVVLSMQGPPRRPSYTGIVTVAVVVELVALKSSFGITGMLFKISLLLSLWCLPVRNSFFIVGILLPESWCSDDDVGSTIRLSFLWGFSLMVLSGLLDCSSPAAKAFATAKAKGLLSVWLMWMLLLTRVY